MSWLECDIDEIVFEGENGRGTLIEGDCTELDLGAYYSNVQLVYIDPPTRDECFLRQRVGKSAYSKNKFSRSIYLPSFSEKTKQEYIAELEKMAKLAYELLHDEGVLFFHAKQEYQAEIKLMLDSVFGENALINTIIWRYYSGGKGKSFFSRRHDVIFYYAKGENRYFNIEALAIKKKKQANNHLKRLVDDEGRSYRTIVSKGKSYVYYDDEPIFPDDVWDEEALCRISGKTGHQEQRPGALMERLVLSSSRRGDLAAELCAGSCSFSKACSQHGRRYLGIELSRNALFAGAKQLFGDNLRLKLKKCEAELKFEMDLFKALGYYDMRLSDDGSNESESIDQCYYGFIKGKSFNAHKWQARRKEMPSFDRSVELPMIDGEPAVLLVDVYGNYKAYKYMA